MAEDSLTDEYGGETLCRYEVECDPAAGVGSVGRLSSVKDPTLFETTIMPPQLRLFDLDEILDEEGWIKVLKLDEYAPRQSRRPDELQQALFHSCGPRGIGPVLGQYGGDYCRFGS